MSPAERPLTRELLDHPFLKMGCDPSEFAPLVEKAKEESNRKFEDEDYGESEAW